MFRSLKIVTKSVLGGALAWSLTAPLDGARAVTFKVVYAFKGFSQRTYDGIIPTGTLIADKNGNLYGTTNVGGANLTEGTVFRVSPGGVETVLYSFSNGQGHPLSGVVMGRSGNLYGTVLEAPQIFKLAPDGTAVFYSFPPIPWGSFRLLLDKPGNLYGTTFGGGSGLCNYGCGTVYKLSSAWAATTLYSFKGGIDGQGPMAGLVADRAGNLYGTTVAGGGESCFGKSGGCGTVFKLARDGTKTLLYSFKGGDDGAYPQTELLMDKFGNLFGTTDGGGGTGCGGDGCGTAFRLAPDGTETVIHAFVADVDGAIPSPLIEDNAGNLYGTTNILSIGKCYGQTNCGTAFMLAPDGTETILHTFHGTDGGAPNGGLYRDKRGNLFGTMGGWSNPPFLSSAASKLEWGAIYELQK